jgi:hypothetical protein
MSDDLVARRFWAKVSKTDGCWNWTAARFNSGAGYGQLWVNRRLVGAHRLSWQIHNGTIPSGLLVLHSCDNKACVNPAHLFLGTLSDNAKDAARKRLLGRNQKLSPELVIRIRQMRERGMSGTEIGAAIGISAAHARKVARGVAWDHITQDAI